MHLIKTLLATCFFFSTVFVVMPMQTQTSKGKDDRPIFYQRIYSIKVLKSAEFRIGVGDVHKLIAGFFTSVGLLDGVHGSVKTVFTQREKR